METRTKGERAVKRYISYWKAANKVYASRLKFLLPDSVRFDRNRCIASLTLLTIITGLSYSYPPENTAFIVVIVVGLGIYAVLSGYRYISTKLKVGRKELGQ